MRARARARAWVRVRVRIRARARAGTAPWVQCPLFFYFFVTMSNCAAYSDFVFVSRIHLGTTAIRFNVQTRTQLP